MELSDVFYEAACRMEDNELACHAIAIAVRGYAFIGERSVSVPECDEYVDLMSPSEHGFIFGSDISEAAPPEWSNRDFRTFMLLMASEAVRV